MYFVMKPDARLVEKKFMVFGPDSLQGTDETFDYLQFARGTALGRKAKPIALSDVNKRKQPLGDLLFNALGLDIHSTKLRATLADLGVTNIEYIPTKLTDQTAKREIIDYQLANFLGLLTGVVDLKNSRVIKGTRKPIIGIEEFQLLEKNVKPLPGMKKAPLIFRVAEHPTLVIAHEAVKDRCEADGLTGVHFVPTTEWC